MSTALKSPKTSHRIMVFMPYTHPHPYPHPCASAHLQREQGDNHRDQYPL